MKVLIVGGTAAIAGAVKTSLGNFADVATVGRHSCDIQLDLSWPADRFRLPSGFDTVVNVAAAFSGPDFETVLTAEDVNVLGALKLAHSCRQAGIRHLVHVSTIFTELSEESPFFNFYALSKRHGEDVVRFYCRSAQLNLTILRPSRIYGQGTDFRRHQPFLYDLMDKVERGDDIEFAGSNDATRNFIHVDDVAEVISRIVRRRIHGEFVCAGLENKSLSEIAQLVASAFHAEPIVTFDNSRPDIPDCTTALDHRLYKLIDYYPEVSLAKGLSREAARRRACL